MASFLDKVKVNTAVTKFNKFDLSCDHITTTDWMHLTPIYNKEMVPKEKLSVNVEAMTRLAPMAVPTFGRGNINMRAFFVPYRTVFPGWNDFINDVRHMPANMQVANYEGTMISTVPIVTNSALRGLFIGDQGESNVNSGLCMIYNTEPSVEYDFVFVDDSDNNHWLVLNPKGRRVLKIIESLGYKIQWKVFGQNYEPRYSALPLLCYAKVYCDWYWPQQYAEAASGLEQLFKQDNAAPISLNSNQLWQIFSVADLVCYDADYFTGAFDNPVGPNTGSSSTISLVDITNNRNVNNAANGSQAAVHSQPGSTYGPSNGTPWIGVSVGPGSSYTGQITQYALDGLKRLTDYMKRHQIAGAKALDRFFSRFGIALSSEKLNRSVYIGSKLVPLQIGDVTSQTDTTALGGMTNDPYGYDRLGSFCGRGVGYGQGNFDFETDEYGMFVICSSVVPSVGYYQGVDRSVLHTNKLDFWTPEFDQLGTQAIAASELVVPKDGRINDDIILNDSIFGYAPRYAEYKIAKDKVTGDYRVNHINKSLMANNGWHFMREFPDDWDSFVNFAPGNSDYANYWITHSPYFLKGEDANQFNRIFQSFSNSEAASDHFAVIYHFDVGMTAPMCKLWDTYEFDESDRGKEVTMDVNGVKMN